MTEDREELQHEADRAGLTTVAATHRAQFRKARAAAERWIRSIPRDIPMDVEPAHTFRANEEA